MKTKPSIWLTGLGCLLSLWQPLLQAETTDHSNHSSMADMSDAPKQDSGDQNSTSENKSSHSSEAVSSEKEGITYKYVCPMHPQIVRDHEGTCPICGMTLVKQAFQAEDEAPKISAGGGNNALKQGLAIRTATVQKATLWKYIPTYGRVTADDSKVVHVHPRASGWISHLSVRSNGERIKKGQQLYNIYSPEIVSAQQDLLLAKQRSAASSLLNSARTRLELLGVSKQTIRQIERQRKVLDDIPVYAPQTGVIGNLIVQNGMYVEPSTELMSLTDLSTVWLEAEVLPLQQAWLKPNLTADIKFQAYPGRRWESQIDYIYPTADAKTQAVKVRMTLMNHKGLLKPNMLADVAIYGGPKKNTLAIPLEAVIDDGEEKRVVQQLDDGRFQVQTVVTGMQTQDMVEVLSGVNAGEKIIVSGQFLIDSESQIKANLRRLASQAAKDKKPSDDGFESMGSSKVGSSNASHDTKGTVKNASPTNAHSH